MKKCLIFYSLITAILAFSVGACTEIYLNPMQSRFNDNFNGSLSSPSDVDPSGTNVFSIAFMGDAQIAGSGEGDRLEAALSDASAKGVSFAVVAGDLSNSGRDYQFDRYLNIMNNSGLTYYSVIGNHDIFFDGWKEYKSKIGRSIYTITADNLQLFVIDAANGLLGRRQLKWLEEELSNSSASHKIVVGHYPPWVGKLSSYFKMDSEEEAAILKDILYRNNVKYMFAGHYHGFEKIQIGKTWYITSGGVNHQLDLGQRAHYTILSVNGSDLSLQVVYID